MMYQDFVVTGDTVSDLEWLMTRRTSIPAIPDRIGYRLFRGYVNSMAEAAAAKKATREYTVVVGNWDGGVDE